MIIKLLISFVNKKTKYFLKKIAFRLGIALIAKFTSNR